jgi:hypothetical protein
MPAFKSKAKRMYGPRKTLVTNTLRKKDKSVEIVISEEAKRNKVEVLRTRKNQIQTTNSYGSFLEKEILKSIGSNALLQGTIGASKLADPQLLWKMIPDGESVMRVEINTSNHLYKYFYTGEKKNERLTAVIDAMLIGIAFAEINCKTENSKEIFEDINRAVGHLLNRLIDKKVIK